jgi:CheY-like chemotaxis protein
VARILVVDDEPDIRLLARVILERAGHAISEAGSGEEAIEALRSDAPDLMVLDIRMQGMDGWEVLEEVRSDETLRRVPIVMLSAHTTPSSADRALALGAKAFVTKPFTWEHLRRVVDDGLAA